MGRIFGEDKSSWLEFSERPITRWGGGVEKEYFQAKFERRSEID